MKSNQTRLVVVCALIFPYKVTRNYEWNKEKKYIYVKNTANQLIRKTYEI